MHSGVKFAIMFLPPTGKIDYINMRVNYVDMQIICDNMHHI